MTGDHDVERVVRSWLDDGVTALPDRVLDDVLGRLPETQQRRSWRAARRSRMNSTLKTIMPFAAVLIAVVAGATLLPAAMSVAVGPSGTPSPSTTATPSVPFLSTQPYAISPGTYRVSTYSADVRITVPEGWHRFEDGPGFSAIVDDTAVPEGFRAVAFWTVDRTYADPCGDLNAEVPIGPSVDDLVAVLSDIPHTTASTPIQTSIGGVPATKLQLFLSRELPCPPARFHLWEGRYAQGPAERDNVWVLEVDGERLLILAEWLPGVTEDDLTELGRIVDSIEIQPAGG
jgi:hypothetical protein